MKKIISTVTALATIILLQSFMFPATATMQKMEVKNSKIVSLPDKGFAGKSVQLKLD